MKINKIIALTAALSCAVLTTAVNAATIYSITNGTVTQKLSVSGCKPLKATTTATVTFDNAGTYTMVPAIGASLAGEWFEVNSGSTKTIYMHANDASMVGLYNAFDIVAVGICQAKYPAATVVIIRPSAIVHKNIVVVKINKNTAVSTMQIKGKETSNLKGKVKVGTIISTTTLKGNWVVAP